MTDPAGLTPAQLIAEAGRALYGADWQAPLSRALEVNLRTVQRVAAAAEAGGDYRPAASWAADVARLIEGRAGVLSQLHAALTGKST